MLDKTTFTTKNLSEIDGFAISGLLKDYMAVIVEAKQQHYALYWDCSNRMTLTCYVDGENKRLWSYNTITGVFSGNQHKYFAKESMKLLAIVMENF